MQNAVINRIFALIGQPGNQRFDSLRWGPVLERYRSYYAFDLKQKPSQFQITADALYYLHDSELLDLYETALLAYHKDLT